MNIKKTEKANKIKSKAIKDLKQYLKNVSSGLNDIISSLEKDKKSNEKTVTSLNKIDSKIRNLDNLIEKIDEEFNVTNLHERITAIIHLLNDIKFNKLKQEILIVENLLILAKLNTKLLVEIQKLLDNPDAYKLRILYKEEIAKKIQEYLPLYSRCDIAVEYDSKSVSISFSNKDADIFPMLNALKPEVVKLFKWSMIMTGDIIYYEIHLIKEYSVGMLYCIIDIEPIVYDPSS